MYWTSLLLSIAAGMVAVMIARGFIRRAKWGRGAYYTAFLIGAFGFWLLLDDTVTPVITLDGGGDAVTVESALRGLGYYELLLAHDSAESRRIRERIERALADPGYSEEKRRAVSAEIHARLYSRYAPRASDSAMVGFLRSQLRIVRALLDRDSNACYAYVRKENASAGRVKLLLPPELLAADSLATHRLIESGIRAPAEPYDTVLARNLMAAVYDTLFARDPRQAALLTDRSTASQRKRDYCAIVLDLYRIVLALPHGDAAIAARRLLGSDEG